MYIKQVLFSVCLVAGATGSAVFAFDDSMMDNVVNYEVEIIHTPSAQQDKSNDDSIVIGSSTYKENSSSEKNTAKQTAQGTGVQTSGGDDEWETDAGTSVTAKTPAKQETSGSESSSGSRDLGLGCSKPEPLPDVTVDTPKIQRIDLTAVSSTYTIVKGDTVGRLVTSLMPQGASVTSNQLLAAIMRANPKSFNKGNIQVGGRLDIPSVERIALESDSVGRDIMSRISSGKMQEYTLPPLKLPWEEEEARITRQKSDKAKRDQLEKKQQDDYTACLEAVKRKKEEAEQKKAREIEEARLAAERKAREEWEMENTEADLGSDDFMIQDPEEAKPEKEEEKVVLNEQGKRVIVLKQNKENDDKAASESSSGGRVSGANIVFNGRDLYARDSTGHTVRNQSGDGAGSAELEKVRKELAEAQNVNQALLDEKIRQTEKISRLEEQFEGLSSKLDNIAQMQSIQISGAAEAREEREQQLNREKEESGSSWLWWVLGILGATGVYGVLIVPKIRSNRALREKIEASVYGRMIIDNPLVRKIQELKVKLRSALKSFLEASEQREQEIGERIAQEEKEKAIQEEIEARKSSVLVMGKAGAEEASAAQTEVDAPKPEAPEAVPESVPEKEEYQPTSMVIEIESEPVVPMEFTEEEQLEIPPSTSHSDDIVESTENPEPKTVD